MTACVLALRVVPRMPITALHSLDIEPLCQREIAPPTPVLHAEAELTLKVSTEAGVSAKPVAITQVSSGSLLPVLTLRMWMSYFFINA